MDNFGIPDNSIPNLEDVQQQIEANGPRVVGVVNALMDGVGKLGNENAQKIDRVVKRLQNSVNGHLRRQKAIVGSVANALIAPIASGLDGNQMKIAGAMGDPNVSAYVRQLPMPPSYMLPDVPSPPPDPPSPDNQNCPPGWSDEGNGLCQWCPPGGYGTECIRLPIRQAWAFYNQNQAGVHSSGPYPPTPNPFPPQPPAPPPPPGLQPPFPPPPPPPPPPISPGGVYSTVGGMGYRTVGGSGGQVVNNCPPGWEDMGQGLCRCHVGPPGSLTPDLVKTRLEAWRMYETGFRCGEVQPGPPPAPPPGATAADCPQTYTIIQGPPCPQYAAALGSPASWIASGLKLPDGWTALQTMTDTPANIQAFVNGLTAKCVSATIPSLTPPPATA